MSETLRINCTDRGTHPPRKQALVHLFGEARQVRQRTFSSTPSRRGDDGFGVSCTQVRDWVGVDDENILAAEAMASVDHLGACSDAALLSAVVGASSAVDMATQMLDGAAVASLMSVCRAATAGTAARRTWPATARTTTAYQHIRTVLILPQDSEQTRWVTKAATSGMGG